MLKITNSKIDNVNAYSTQHKQCSNVANKDLPKNAKQIISPTLYSSTPEIYQKQTTFGSKKIAKINFIEILPDKTKKFSKGYISEMFPKKHCDIKTMQEIERLWGNEAIYMDRISEAFFEDGAKNGIYTTITKTKGKKSDKIKSFLICTNPEKKSNKETFFISYLQSAPGIADKYETSTIKGAGELLLYNAVKLAKKYNFANVSLLSTNDEYYNKVGFKLLEDNGSCHIFGLKNCDYDDFLKKIEEKYQIFNKKDNFFNKCKQIFKKNTI